MDVSQTYVVEQLEFRPDTGLVLEEIERVGDRQVQHIRDRLSFIPDLQCFPVVTPALTDLARNVDIGQEVHLDLHQPVALTRFAPPAFDVEREPARPVATQLGLREIGEQLANGREQPRVGRWVGPRRAADRALVDVDHFVDVVEPFDSIVRPWHDLGPIEMARQRLIQDVGHQRRFAGSRNAGHGHEQAERKIDRQLLEIVMRRADDAQHPIGAGDPAPRWHGDAQLAAQVARRQGIGMAQHLVEQPGCDDLTAVAAGARSQIHHIVGRADRFLVVLHD